MEKRIINIANKSSFVDLHIHTNYSNVFGEYGELGLEPQSLMEELSKYQNDTNAKVTISITDHDSIEALKEISKLKEEHSEYKQINIMNGCEFTVSTDTLGAYPDGASKYGQIHLLAYNFDIENKLISQYSYLQDLSPKHSFLHNGKRYSNGSFVFAALKDLNAFNNELNTPFLSKKLKFSDFSDFEYIDNATYEENKVHFLSFLRSKLPDIPEKVVRRLEDRLNGNFVSQNNQLDIIDAMSIIKNAGGVCVLAHPEMVIKSYDERAKSHDENYENILATNCKENGNGKIQTRVNEKVRIVTNLIDNLQTLGLCGIELYHTANINRSMFDALQRYAVENNLYVTGGSDMHGTKKDGFGIGQIFDTNAMKKLNEKIGGEENAIVLTNCAFVDDWELGEIGNDDSIHWATSFMFNIGGKNIFVDWASYYDFVQSCGFNDIYGEIRGKYPELQAEIEKETMGCVLASASILCGEYAKILLDSNVSQQSTWLGENFANLPRSKDYLDYKLQ